MLADAHHARRVLIVDDEAVPRDLESFALEGTGRYLAIETGNATDALTELIGGDYDCAVIDLDMPDMSGLELITMIRNSQDFGRLPIVLVLPDNSGLLPGCAETLGATCVITKPFNPWDLARLLDDFFGDISESPHLLSVEAVLKGFPYPTMIIDSKHHVVLANEVFYEAGLTGIGDEHLMCSSSLHADGLVPAICPLVECMRSGQPTTREVDSTLGRLHVSVYPLAARTGNDSPLFLHVTQPVWTESGQPAEYSPTLGAVTPGMN